MLKNYIRVEANDTRKSVSVALVMVSVVIAVTGPMGRVLRS